MKNKGQAAMEFLMTYGWAILVVLAAVAALAYFGVLNPDRFLPEKCTLPSGVACLDSAGTTSSVVMSIQNAGGFDMSNVNVTLIGASSTSADVDCAPAGDTLLTNGEQDTFTCTATFSSGKLNVPVRLQYTNAQTSIPHTKTGDLILKVE